MNLTLREREILTLLAKGYNYKDIASKLLVTASTIRNHISNIYRKTGTTNAYQIVLLWQKKHETTKEFQSSKISLSPREQEIISLLSKGYYPKQAALMLGISVNTVYQYISRAKLKGVKKI